MKHFIDAVSGNWHRALFAIFMAALLVRVIFILTLQDGFYFLDSVEYSRAAVSLLTSGELGEAYHRPPGYPAFLAAIHAVFGNSILAVRMVESVMGAFAALVIALIGGRIGGNAVGALAGVLWSIHPLGVFIAGLYYPTGLLTMLLACGFLCFGPVTNQGVSAKRVFLAGMLWGLAALTKPIALATIAAVSLWVMVWGRANRLQVVFLLCLGSALVVIPWMIRDYYTYGRVVVVEPRMAGHLLPMRAPEPELQQRKAQAIMKYPREYASRVLSEFVHFWKLYPDRVRMADPEYRASAHEKESRVVQDTIFTTNDIIKAVSILSNGPLFLFAIVGTAAMWLERERRRDLALLWAMILSFAVTYSFFFTQTRYRIPIDPYIIVLSAYGMKKTWDVVRVRFARREQVKAEVEVGLKRVRGSKFEI